MLRQLDCHGKLGPPEMLVPDQKYWSGPGKNGPNLE